MDDKYEKVTSILACDGELGQALEESKGNLKPYPEGGTASVSRKGYAIKSGYLTSSMWGFHNELVAQQMPSFRI